MKTRDRGTEVLTDETIGRKQSLTPEGFLFCEDVRIARTGEMIYASFEMPDIEPGPNGTVIMERDETVLFEAEAMASFNGKPVTNGHPDEFVSPENYQDYAVGVVLAPRRGQGAEAQFLIADMLITDRQAIEAVRSGKREVSCGYESGREQISPGRGRQTNIRGNHVSLEERGRCGPACAIQDQEPDMAVNSKFLTRLRRAFKNNDAEAFEEELAEAAKMDPMAADEEQMPAKGLVHININGMEKPKMEDPDMPNKDGEDMPSGNMAEAMSQIMTCMSEMKDMMGRMMAMMPRPDASADELANEEEMGEVYEDSDKPEPKKAAMAEPGKSADAAAVGKLWRNTVSRAEILAPGLQVPTFDAAAAPKLLLDRLCRFRRQALDAAHRGANSAAVRAVLDGRSPAFDKMTCDAVTSVFNASAAIARDQANRRAAPDATFAEPFQPMSAKKLSGIIAERNKRSA